ncbi:M20 aminoacylase family protein [Pseudogemmobacter faecipullorum]|uniref:Amidohydrolase n=1 Tax=Pseudogemmobacter faecipullorum TaxID=2755041 RepID=A0ABS8CIF9_9RHOB|nr:M20 aminoacylase family protein [Pseudogemmobacter faecipullorum]MCB5409179.1 amidohydrolase [Pseudogemmobacter faecipullorum]
MPVRNRIAELAPEIAAWRRDFHRFPELDYDLPRTAGRVAELCRSFGCDAVTEGIGRSGVVAVIKGRNDSSGRVIGLRADMDALPIHETSGVPYASQTPGAMHACGHDGHTAMLLGAAKYLAETRNFDGQVVCIFQPAEEGGGGGLAMLKDGLVGRWGIDEVYGMHNMPGLATGQFAIRSGAIMAASDQFIIRVTGRGGHAAKPHEAIDTTLVAAHIVVAVQSIVSRNTDPLKSAVVSVSTLASDSTAYNVLAQDVVMKGTIRALDEDVRNFSEAQLRRIVEGTAAMFGAKAELEYFRGYPVTVNHADHTAFAAAVAEAISPGVDSEVAPLMAAEDFSYMLEARPGAYIFLGNGATAPLHHAGYDFDDAAIPYGVSWFAGMAESRMPVA